MARVEASIQIDRPAADVFAYATNVDSMSEWLSVLVETEQLSDGPMGVGTKVRTVGVMLGRRMDAIIEVTAFELGEVRVSG